MRIKSQHPTLLNFLLNLHLEFWPKVHHNLFDRPGSFFDIELMCDYMWIGSTHFSISPYKNIFVFSQQLEESVLRLTNKLVLVKIGYTLLPSSVRFTSISSSPWSFGRLGIHAVSRSPSAITILLHQPLIFMFMGPRHQRSICLETMI